jgi:hypothetical protein
VSIPDWPEAQRDNDTCETEFVARLRQEEQGTMSKGSKQQHQAPNNFQTMPGSNNNGDQTTPGSKQQLSNKTLAICKAISTEGTS